MSNNAVDKSVTSASLTVKTDLETITINPLTGYITGGTPVTITVTGDFKGTVFCQFGIFSPIQAYKTDSTHYVCISPKSSSGNTVLVISDETFVTLHTTNFLYVPIPQYVSVSPSLIPKGISSDVTFFGTDFINTIGR